MLAKNNTYHQFETKYFKGIIRDTTPLYGRSSKKYMGELFWKDSGDKYCDFHCCAANLETMIAKINNDMFVDYRVSK